MVPIHYLAKVLIFIESKTFVYRFARYLSKFCLKSALLITKRNDFLVKFITFANKFDDDGTEIQQQSIGFAGATGVLRARG